MSAIIKVDNAAVNAMLAQLVQKMGNVSPVLPAIGEDIVERTKQRFVTSTAPDGTRWKPNTRATITNYIQTRGGFSKKTGRVLAKGRTLGMGKRPLIARGDLAKFIYYNASSDDLTIGSSMVYAAMQHFGGQKSSYPNLWGDIPARPFMPITPAGELYPAEAEKIVEMLREFLLK